MREEFYQMYKSMRELIALAEAQPLSDNPLREFVRESKINCERYDRSNPDCLKRWLKEKQDNGFSDGY